MVHLKIKKGIDILIDHPPIGSIQDLRDPELIGLDLSFAFGLRMHLLKEVGDEVLIGEPIAKDKDLGRTFISCASGKIKEIIRGKKRSVQTIVIERKGEKYYEGEKIAYESLTREEIVKKLHDSGLLIHIRSRPFDRIAHPDRLPKSIFIKGLESAPFVPPAETQLEGFEKLFQEGVHLLSKIADGNLHLVIRKESSSFENVENVHVHTAQGPHPISNPSIHIYKIDPITNPHEVVWTVSVLDVISIGKWATSGVYHIDRILSLAGPAVLKEKAGYYRAKMGYPISEITNNRLAVSDLRFISGDPLMGNQVMSEGFLGFSHTCVSVFSENKQREPFHFFRLGRKKYTQSKTYLFGFLKKKPYPFTTNQHGEERPFVDGQIYEKVMPMRIPTMQLIKSIISEDFDTALELGLLEIAPEDFALATFICPSKINMVQIVFEGLKKYSEESAL